jgi:hypothetical protein
VVVVRLEGHQLGPEPLVGIDLPAVRQAEEDTIDHLRGSIGQEAWEQGMNPDIPATKILDNPYTYTEFRSSDTHSVQPASAASAAETGE